MPSSVGTSILGWGWGLYGGESASDPLAGGISALPRPVVQPSNGRTALPDIASPGIALIAGVLDEARKGARRPVLRIDSRGINA